MNEIIYNDTFLRKVFNQEIVKDIVIINHETNNLNRSNKVNYAIDYLQKHDFIKGRVIIEFQEDTKRVLRLLHSFNITEYEIVRRYTVSNIRPGLLSMGITKQNLNIMFIKKIIQKLYDYDYERPGSLNLTLYIVLDKGENGIIGLRYFDDRGFCEFAIQPYSHRILDKKRLY